MKKRVLTGTRPSGTPHLGNYFGAYKPAIDLQNQYELYFFLADLHALNGSDTAENIKIQSFDLVATMIACGFDTKKAVFYTQSSVPEVCELAWVLGCQAPYGLLQRAHSFKDAQAKGIDVNMGVFNYPVLMAADILLYDAHKVPVGQDQKQHLEMTRDIAQRFNNRYGDHLTLPEPLIADDVAVVPGIDGEKMSKSKGNVVPVIATDKIWKKAIMGIVTDSLGVEAKKDPETCTVYKLYRVVCEDQDKVHEMAANYRGGGYGYGHAKMALLEAVKERFSPMRDRYVEIAQDYDYLRSVVVRGAQQARFVAVEKLKRIRKVVGLIG